MPHRTPAGRRALRRALLVLCTLATSATALAVPAAARGGPSPEHLPPVEAPVVDPFRPPEGPYGAGNRGLQYDTAPGAPVRATADGVVTFAGNVAGTRHVTVLHADGIRTSYSFLAEIGVVVGQRVAQGDVLGTTVDDLHLGARAGDAYFDPASLFGGGPPRVRLVPFGDPPGPGAAGERSALRQLVDGVGGALGGLGDALGGGLERLTGGLGRVAGLASWLLAEGPQLIRTLAHYSNRFVPVTSMAHMALTAYQAWNRAQAAADRPCSEPGGAPPEPPPGRRVAVLVAGLGSTSDNGAIDDVDTAALGYDEPDVLRYSYEGGRTPDPSDAFATIGDSAYTAADTQGDLREAGARLADLVEDVVAAAPGTPVDLYAHSQGGLVVRLALIELEARHGEAWLGRLGLVATMGTPHGGADLATGIHALGSTRAGSIGLDVVATVGGLELDDDAVSVAQLSETSDVVAELARSPIPASVRAVSIAARGDLVVPVPRTVVPGATEVVVPVDGMSAHDALPGSPEAARELALALAGLPPTCQSFGSALADQAIGEGISLVEDIAGAAAWFGAARLAFPIGG